MKIALASDHAGFLMKEHLKNWLLKNSEFEGGRHLNRINKINIKL
jgi:ribose 5-phosphate isomerase RpiB